MKITDAITKLTRLDACPDAVEWLKTQRGIREAWRRCPRGDWLLWLADRLCEPGDDLHRATVLAACDCARLALKYVSRGDVRPLAAIDTAERWARREPGVTLAQVSEAASAAALAALEAAWAAAAAARADTLSKCATIVRRHITIDMILDAMEKS